MSRIEYSVLQPLAVKWANSPCMSEEITQIEGDIVEAMKGAQVSFSYIEMSSLDNDDGTCAHSVTIIGNDDRDFGRRLTFSYGIN